MTRMISIMMMRTMSLYTTTALAVTGRVIMILVIVRAVQGILLKLSIN